jgi:methyl-accepting chemotaxis protein
MQWYRNLSISLKLGLNSLGLICVLGFAISVYMEIVGNLSNNLTTQLKAAHEIAAAVPESSPQFTAVQQTIKTLDERLFPTPFGAILLNDPNFVSRVRERTSLLAVIGLVVGLVLQFFITRSISRPLREVQQVTERVAQGDFTRDVNTTGSDEIGKLAVAFNAMTQNLRELVSTVSEESARAQAAEQEARAVSEEIEAQRAYLAASVAQLLVQMEYLANGDLTARVDVPPSEDEIGKLCTGFNTTVQIMREMILAVAEAVETASDAGDEILTGTNQMAAGIHEQTLQTSGVATAMEEMTSTIAENTHRAATAAREASRSSDEAERSRAIMEEATNGMNRIADTVLASAATIQELGRSSEEIGEIAGVIEEIADQTNLLALNAAIEAARAGEQGRGFAVVADEVRKLAERTQKATKQITLTIKRIQTETSSAVQAMADGTREAERGKESVARTAEALQRMITQTAAVSGNIFQLAAASEEQAATSDGIARAIDAITIVAKQSAQVTHTIGKISTDLHSRMNALRGAIERFQVGGGEKQQQRISHLNEAGRYHLVQQDTVIPKRYMFAKPPLPASALLIPSFSTTP